MVFTPTGRFGRLSAMPRELRIEYPGVIYHVMNRRRHREPIFCDDHDRRGAYFWKETALNNATAPVWEQINVVSGANQDNRYAFLPKTPEAFTHDADGNLTQDGRWTYTWDAENRLVKQESLSSAPTASKYKLEFAYDHQGRRIQKKVSTWVSGNWSLASDRRFVYDGWNLIAVLSSSSSLLSSFTWGLDLSGSIQGAGGVGGLLAVTDASLGTHFCAYDGNGNVRTLVNAANGTVSAGYEYGPFGELIRKSGVMANANPFRFSTKYQDDESDMLYYGYRSFNPSTGRWLSRDPIEERGGKNLYAFVQNDPLIRFDKLGLRCCLITYPAGYYGGAKGAGGHFSVGGHSVLQCDNGAYVSFYPEQNGDASTQWHTPESDQNEYANGPTPQSTCFDCLDESRVQDWLNNARNNDHWTPANNCSDASSSAAAAGLPQPQNKPNCPCSADRFKRWVIVDLLNPDVAINLPSDTATRFSDLVENGCQRYKCVLKNAH